MKNLNLLQKSGMLQTVKQQKQNTSQAIQLNLKQKLLNQVFVIILMYFNLVTRNITVAANNDTYVAFKNWAPFSTCKTVINDLLIDEANHIYTPVSMYNLIEYSDNYSDTSGSLWKFKRDEGPANNADLTIDNSESFKYEAALLGKAKYFADQKRSVKDTKIVVPLNYLSKFWRSLEMPLINWKVYLELNWIEGCILSSVGNSAKFGITDARLRVPINTWSNKDQ